MTDVHYTAAPELSKSQMVNSIYFFIDNETWAPGIAFPTGYNPPTKTETCRDKDFYYCVSNQRLYQYKGDYTPTGSDNWFDLQTAANAITSCGTNPPTGGEDGDLYNRYNTGDIYQKIDGTWTIIGTNFLVNSCNKGLPLGSGSISFRAINFQNKDPDKILQREANLGLLLTSDMGYMPILATDQSFLVKKDITAGGFLATNQGALWFGHGLNYQNEVPKIVLSHTSPIYTDPEYDTLYFTKFDFITPANVNLGILEVGKEDTVSKQENTVRYSQDFSNSLWTGYSSTDKSNITQNTLDVTDPAGTNNAAKIIITAGKCTGCYQTVSPSLEANQTYTVSIWFRGTNPDTNPENAQKIVLGFNNEYKKEVKIIYNKWVRYSYTKKIESGHDTSRGIQFYSQDNYTLYVYGAQLEKDNGAHWYSPTDEYIMPNRLALKSPTGITAIMNSDGQLGELRTSNLRLDHLYSSSAGGIYVNDTLRPNGNRDIGLDGTRWNNIYANHVYANEFHGSTTGIRASPSDPSSPADGEIWLNTGA